MKTKKKISLDNLKLISSVLNTEQQRLVVAGSAPTITSHSINGGGEVITYDWS